MKKGFTDNFLAGAIFTAVFSLLMMAGSMLYAIIAGFENGTDITITAEHVPGDAGFDPNALPATAAGKPARSAAVTFDCKDMIYQTTGTGIKYVRELGGVYNAAVINGKFGLYRLEYGNLKLVENTALDPDSIRKLRYALENCKAYYIRSGAQLLTSTGSFAPLG